MARARALRDACERHGVPVKAAAMQFPLAHPAVAGLIAGVRTPAHLDEYPALLRLPIPGALWDELRSSGHAAGRDAGAGARMTARHRRPPPPLGPGPAPTTRG